MFTCIHLHNTCIHVHNTCIYVHNTCIYVHNTGVHVMRLLKKEVNVTNLFLIKSSQCVGPSAILKSPG